MVRFAPAAFLLNSQTKEVGVTKKCLSKMVAVLNTNIDANTIFANLSVHLYYDRLSVGKTNAGLRKKASRSPRLFFLFKSFPTVRQNTHNELMPCWNQLRGNRRRVQPAKGSVGGRGMEWGVPVTEDHQRLRDTGQERVLRWGGGSQAPAGEVQLECQEPGTAITGYAVLFRVVFLKAGEGALGRSVCRIQRWQFTSGPTQGCGQVSGYVSVLGT